MGSHFRRNVMTTSGFFVLRFIVAIMVAFAYILVAAGIQYAVVGVLGESTFNYIVGGLLSLFLGAILCDRGGALIFMFVRGWHVSALAYANKIRRSHAPAVTVGMKAFAKNIVGFGAVYGVRAIAKNLLADFKDKLWELLKDVPLAQNLQQVAENPVVEHLASDVLNYGFDATIFYLIKNPPKDVNDIPSTVLEGLKKYLYCLPSIMLTSISSYILFRFLPKLCKWLLIIWMFFTQGFCAGILITVLMWPIFYILDNAFFSPLTMVMFISCFSKKCEEGIDEESPAVQFVNSILDGTGIGTTAEEMDEEGAPEEDAGRSTRSRRKPQQPPEEEPILDVQPDMSEVEGQPAPVVPPPPEDILGASPGNPAPWMRNVPPIPGDGIPPRGAEPLWDDLPLAEEPAAVSEPVGSSQPATGFDAILSSMNAGGHPAPGGPGSASGSLADLLRNFNARDLGQALDGGGDEDDDGGSPGIADILSGGDF